LELGQVDAKRGKNLELRNGNLQPKHIPGALSRLKENLQQF